MRHSRLTILFLFVFVDLLGYSLFLPLLPYMAGALGASPVAIGLLVSSNAVAQLLAAPIFGRLSDRFGRRPLLIVSVAGTMAAFVLLIVARSLPMLFFSRILDGLLGGNTTLAQAYITDITGTKDRAKGLGMIGAAFGLGFIVGPAMGGALSNWAASASWAQSVGLTRYAVPAILALSLATADLILLVGLLPESLSAKRRAALRRSPGTSFTAGALWQAVRRPCVGPLLSVRFLYSLAFGLFQSNFALYAATRLGLSDRSTSYVLTYVGVLVVLVQGVAVRWLTARYEERPLIYYGLILMAGSLLAWAIVPTVWLLLVALAPLALAAGLLSTVLNSYLTKTVSPEEAGGTLGLSSSLDSLARVMAPAGGGALIQTLGAASLGVIGSAITVALVIFARQRIVRHPEFALPGCGWQREDLNLPEPGTAP